MAEATSKDAPKAAPAAPPACDKAFASIPAEEDDEFEEEDAAGDAGPEDARVLRAPE